LLNRASRKRLIRMLGSLPLVADYARRLRIGPIVNRHCPSRGNAHLTHAQVALAIIANRLTQPRALYQLLDWARKWAVGEIFHFNAEHLNDDRLARCLDALAPNVDAIQGDILVQAVREFDLDLSQLHWDLTSVVLEGEYEEGHAAPAAPDPGNGEGVARTAKSKEEPPHPAPAYPQPAYGYGGRSDRKQLRVGELVTHDGKVPAWHRTFNGNQADVGTVVQVMEALRQHVSLPDCLVIGDSKLLSAAVMRKLRRQRLHFLAPLPRNAELEREFLALDPEGWKKLEYVSQREAKRPPEARTQYLGQEVPWRWRDPETGREETFRRLYVISSEERDTCRKVRQKKLVQAAQELNALLAKAGNRGLKTREQMEKRAEKVLERRRLQGLIRVTVRMVSGVPELRWEVDEAALQAAERLDGYYVLLCSWPSDRADSSSLLRRWKQEWQVEQRFADWKGPLKVRPVFVTTRARMAALLLLLHLALMIYCLLEREARRALAARGQEKVRNLLAGQVDAVPTGANILRAFEHLFLIIEEGPPRELTMTEFSLVQETLWKLLGVREPDWAACVLER
jgi:transposase